MSKIVVGMKMRPAIMPQRMDCGFRNTSAIARPALLIQSSLLSRVGADGISR
jgi:hypothetical protein